MKTMMIITTTLLMGFLLFACQEQEFYLPVESDITNGGDITDGGNIDGEWQVERVIIPEFYKYSYLITAQPDSFVAYFDITYFLHRDQNIAVGIYSNPPIELRQIVIGNEYQTRGIHTLRIYAEPQIESGLFYWVKMIMEDRDFYTYIYRR